MNQDRRSGNTHYPWSLEGSQTVEQGDTVASDSATDVTLPADNLPVNWLHFYSEVRRIAATLREFQTKAGLCQQVMFQEAPWPQEFAFPCAFQFARYGPGARIALK